MKFSNRYFFVANGHSSASLFEHPATINAGLSSEICRGLLIRLGEKERPISMQRPQLILPRADAACGKVFYKERRTANEHRIVLNFWNQATGDLRKGYSLTVYRCKRCGGFHIGQKRIDSSSVCVNARDAHDWVNQD